MNNETKQTSNRKGKIGAAEALSFKEYVRLLECLRKDKEYKWEAYAVISFCSACRVSDVTRIRWSDILDNSDIIIEEKKTKKVRKIHINPSAMKRLKDIYKLMGRPDRKDLVMRNQMGDKPITSQYINRKLKEFKKRYDLDIERFSTHTFRKTFGRYVFELNGESEYGIVLLNRILKHSTLQQTMDYIGISNRDINEIFDSIKI